MADQHHSVLIKVVLHVNSERRQPETVIQRGSENRENRWNPLEIKQRDIKKCVVILGVIIHEHKFVLTFKCTNDHLQWPWLSKILSLAIFSKCTFLANSH